LILCSPLFTGFSEGEKNHLQTISKTGASNYSFINAFFCIIQIKNEEL